MSVSHCDVPPPAERGCTTLKLSTGSFQWDHTVGIQKDPEAPIIFIHVDDLKICPPPDRPAWTQRRQKHGHCAPARWLFGQDHT